jgi:hypothetical protein
VNTRIRLAEPTGDHGAHRNPAVSIPRWTIRPVYPSRPAGTPGDTGIKQEGPVHGTGPSPQITTENPYFRRTIFFVCEKFFAVSW